MFTTTIKNLSDNKRILNIMISGVIVQSEYWCDETGADLVSKEIGNFKATDQDEIRVQINSGGGSYFAGVAIYNTLKLSPANVITQNMGLAASAACVIFMAGNERIVYPGTSTMTHDPLNYVYGNADDLRNAADTLDDICESAKGVFLDAGIDSVKLVELMKAEKMLNPDQAVEFGFATSCNKDLNVSNCIVTDSEKQLAIDNTFGDKVKAKKQKEPKADNLKSKSIALSAEKVILACSDAGLSDLIATFHAKGFTENELNDNIKNIKDIKTVCAASSVSFESVKDSIFNQGDLLRAFAANVSVNDDEDEQIEQQGEPNTQAFSIAPNNGLN